MSRKNTLVVYKIFTAGSMTGNLTSPAVNIQYLDNTGIELDWSGTPVGTFNVQVSISYTQDSQGNITNAGTWNNITLNPQPAATGSAGSYYIEVNQTSATWIRVTYTAGSSTGTLNGYVSSKEV